MPLLPALRPLASLPALLAQTAPPAHAAPATTRADTVRLGPMTLNNAHLVTLAEHIGAIAVTLAVAAVLLRLVPVLERLILRAAGRNDAARPGGATTSMIDRRQRAETLTRVTSSVARAVIWSSTVIAILGRVGIEIGPLVAGAGIAGAAVAFGSQSIIKDFFSGFFILLENQFDVGDTVTIGAVTGTVERMTMRITVVRDANGTAHFIPNSSIGAVANKTDGWGRSTLDVVFAPAVPDAEVRAALEDAARRATGAAERTSAVLEPVAVEGPAELAPTGVTWRLVGRAPPHRATEARALMITALAETLRARHFVPDNGAWGLAAR